MAAGLQVDGVTRIHPAASEISVLPYEHGGQLQAKIRGDAANPEWHARLGEFYLFEIDWLSRAIESFKAAARLAPDRLEYNWRPYDLYINDSAVGGQKELRGKGAGALSGHRHPMVICRRSAIAALAASSWASRSR
jgi:hypothetical protein